MLPNNLFSDIPKDLSSEVFDTLLKGSHIRIERIISSGQSTPEGSWYDQEEHEWVILLQGSAAIRFANNPQVSTLAPGDFINIPAHSKHRVEWTDAEDTTIWLAIFYQ